MKTLAQTPCANAQPTTPVVAPQGPADPTTSRPYETAGRFKPLGPTPDAEDLDLHVDRCAPALLTARCRELVPGLGFVEGVVVEAGPDGVIASLPLLPGPMNQNAIHLASNPTTSQAKSLSMLMS